MELELSTDKFNCVHDNPYKTYCTIVSETWSNPTGRQLSLLPFGINHNKTIGRYSIENLSKFKDSKNSHHLFPNTKGKYMPPQTIDPRPAVKIGYEYRNS